MSGCAAPAPAGSRHSTRVLPAASVVVSGCGTCWQPASSAHAAIATMDVVLMVPKPTPADSTEKRNPRDPCRSGGSRELLPGTAGRARGFRRSYKSVVVARAALASMAQSPAAAHDQDTMFTTVAHYTDPIEARRARGGLLWEGVDGHLGAEHLALANGEGRRAVGGVKLRVADRDADRARAVRRAMDAGEYALDADSDEQRALRAPDRESWSSRL